MKFNVMDSQGEWQTFEDVPFRDKSVEMEVRGMGYDAWMEIDTGGESLACVSPPIWSTGNNAGIFRTALGFNLTDLNGMEGGDAASPLSDAVDYLANNENSPELLSVIPAGEFGGLEPAARFLECLLKMCSEHPKAQIHISN